MPSWLPPPWGMHAWPWLPARLSALWATLLLSQTTGGHEEALKPHTASHVPLPKSIMPRAQAECEQMVLQCEASTFKECMAPGEIA